MKKVNVFKWGACAFALTALASPVLAQQENNTEETVKVTILSKTIDENGQETVEKIVRRGKNLEELQLDQPIDTEQLKSKIEELTDIDIEINLEGIEQIDLNELNKTIEGLGDLGDINVRLTDVEKLQKVTARIAEDPEEEDKLLFMYKSANSGEGKPFLGVTIEEHEDGVKLTKIMANTAAKAAGLQAGDLIVALAGRATTNIEALHAAIAEHKVGDKVTINYIRDGKQVNTSATLQAKRNDYIVAHQHHRRHRHYEFQQELDPCKKLEELQGEPFLGVYITNDEDNDGANISSIIQETGAASSKLQGGDIITAINGESVNDYASLRTTLLQYQPGETVKLSFNREGKLAKTNVLLTSLAERQTARVNRLEELCDAAAITKNNEAEAVEAQEMKAGEMTEIMASPSLEVFPNPAKDIVMVQFEGGLASNTTIRVLTVDGKEVLNRTLGENNAAFSEQMDLTALPRGLYLISVTQGENTISSQVVLQ